MERELNSGAKIPTCNEELKSRAELPNYNEELNSEGREPFTKLGGESNTGPELDGSSGVCVKSGEKNSKSRRSTDTTTSLGSEEILGASSKDEVVRSMKA
ncbi:hypothetical protein GOBAR_AA25065 [Gossypium barbadense]|uniref:Uncharacterized protein n=1 Tax=Gossypium barbadense TaxID=3634 RepID=A0A2P5WWZ5_GOSBA|nr:hypothetical protein GOBAR_AA25065 [Gossypium barbadense]